MQSRHRFRPSSATKTDHSDAGSGRSNAQIEDPEPTHSNRSKLKSERLIPVVRCISKAHVDWKCRAVLRAQATALD